MTLRSVEEPVNPLDEHGINPVIQAELDKILHLASSLATDDGTFQTAIPFLWVMKWAKATPLAQGMLNPSFCVVAQGAKKVHIGPEIVRYGKGRYLASIIDMPTAGQVVAATRSSPYIGIRIDLTNEEIASVMLDANLQIEANDRLPPAAFIGKSSPGLLELLVKLLKLVEHPQDAAFLAPVLKREIIYRLLTGEDGEFFFQHILLNQQTLGIGTAIKWIKENFNHSLSIDQLAKANNMSISSLHHNFKAVMRMGPLQYQKLLRLHEARRLLMAGAINVTTAALKVGYESPSQFNREYRRLFGVPPLKDMNLIRNGSNIHE